mmetsp:Transcript_17140/g.39504  ORF Transcript_17140/g.39504 Transcript_17140/m.39504 type:complete len:342 (-) Transcript_17140:2-1027(-)
MTCCSSSSGPPSASTASSARGIPSPRSGTSSCWARSTRAEGTWRAPRSSSHRTRASRPRRGPTARSRSLSSTSSSRAASATLPASRAAAAGRPAALGRNRSEAAAAAAAARQQQGGGVPNNGYFHEDAALSSELGLDQGGRFMTWGLQLSAMGGAPLEYVTDGLGEPLRAVINELVAVPLLFCRGDDLEKVALGFVKQHHIDERMGAGCDAHDTACMVRNLVRAMAQLRDKTSRAAIDKDTGTPAPRSPDLGDLEGYTEFDSTGGEIAEQAPDAPPNPDQPFKVPPSAEERAQETLAAKLAAKLSRALAEAKHGSKMSTMHAPTEGRPVKMRQGGLWEFSS